jgi:hypothetical protein
MLEHNTVVEHCENGHGVQLREHDGGDDEVDADFEVVAVADKEDGRGERSSGGKNPSFDGETDDASEENVG